jgi:hypothetical protein
VEGDGFHIQDGVKGDWYSWVGSNHRPPVPQTGALNQLSYSCTIKCEFGSQGGSNLGASLWFGKPGALHPQLGSTAMSFRSNAKKPGW